jgi:uncharacterized membrane protein AbrB (regulator of aidB expression)
MAWWLAFGLVLAVGFVYDHDVAQYLPLSDVALRQTMIGASFGLAVGFTIHAFRRRV